MALLSFERKYRVPGGTLIGRDLFDFWIGPFFVGFFGLTSVFFAGSYTVSEQMELYVKAMQFNTETTGIYFNSFYYPDGGTPWSMGYSNYGPAGTGMPNPVTGGTVYMMDWYGIKMFNPPTWDNSFEEQSNTFDLGIRGTLNLSLIHI